ncbi:hypothetical protein Y602_2000 [Burkholderia pseudomallei MSHR733]|uniref:hypothetical protein n=1 Tax=Burkholderia pseudomallei TaxID=28450 RepID=UPI000538F2F5|nr:hypothetical protein [Burkholderia pseudomallei]KGW27275.1 hypothetical protein Y602_2000 [Burkholderia pseudomallei MSHR733]
MIDVKKMRELAKETRYMADVASEIGHAGAAEQFIECAGAILALCDRLEAMEHEREDQNRYLAAQSAEIAGLKQRLSQQTSGEVMEKRILELADKYRIEYGGDYYRNAKEHEIDLLAFVRAVLSDPTQQPSSEVAEQPSFTNPLTPYGMLVRALRIVTNTILGDMAKSLQISSAQLSAMEFGREPVTPEVVREVGKYFERLGVGNMRPALQHAANAARTQGDES